MGMDVSGRTNGAYFRRSVWGWHGLADAVSDLWPTLAGKVEFWHTNDGSGLDEADSHELAGMIRADVASGRVAAYVDQRNAALAALPLEECRICLGKGKRTEEDDIRLLGHPLEHYDHDRPCNGCDGEGTVKNWATNYGLEVSDLSEFADFLAECDGFEIW